jgi:uncharacterized protein (DUF4415 family)
MKTRKRFKAGRGYTKKDWEAVSYNPRWTKQTIAQAKPFAEVFPDLAESIKRARGRPRVEAPKEEVTLRVDPQTPAQFKAKGDDWRTRMARVLDKAKA